MPRPRTLDRDRLLEAAEDVIVAKGVGGFSLGAVALAAGVPKASVQSAFGHKEGLIQALLDRWIAEEDERFTAELKLQKGSRARVFAHVWTTEGEAETARDRIAVLLALLDQAPQNIGMIQAWYARRLGDLSAVSPQDRRARLALLATEGAFLLRFLGLVPMAPETWRDTFEDIAALAWD